MVSSGCRLSVRNDSSELAVSLQPIADLVEPRVRARVVELGPGRAGCADGADDLVTWRSVRASESMLTGSQSPRPRNQSWEVAVPRRPLLGRTRAMYASTQLTRPRGRPKSGELPSRHALNQPQLKSCQLNRVEYRWRRFDKEPGGKRTRTGGNCYRSCPTDQEFGAGGWSAKSG